MLVQLFNLDVFVTQLSHVLVFLFEQSHLPHLLILQNLLFLLQLPLSDGDTRLQVLRLRRELHPNLFSLILFLNNLELRLDLVSLLFLLCFLEGLELVGVRKGVPIARVLRHDMLHFFLHLLLFQLFLFRKHLSCIVFNFLSDLGFGKQRLHDIEAVFEVGDTCLDFRAKVLPKELVLPVVEVKGYIDKEGQLPVGPLLVSAISLLISSDSLHHVTDIDLSFLEKHLQIAKQLQLQMKVLLFDSWSGVRATSAASTQTLLLGLTRRLKVVGQSDGEQLGQVGVLKEFFLRECSSDQTRQLFRLVMIVVKCFKE